MRIFALLQTVAGTDPIIEYEYNLCGSSIQTLGDISQLKMTISRAEASAHWEDVIGLMMVLKLVWDPGRSALLRECRELRVDYRWHWEIVGLKICEIDTVPADDMN